MDEPLLININNNEESEPSKTITNDSKNFNLKNYLKNFVEKINNDMEAFDYSFNTLFFGHQFDKLFLHHDHSSSQEWKKFIQQRRTLSAVAREAILSNDQATASMYCLAKIEGFDEKLFWEKWQFYCFLKDQTSQRKLNTQRKNNSSASSTSLISNREENCANKSSELQLDDWE